jgi:hypothetical protein
MEEDKKYCGTCQKDKLKKDFNKNKTKKDGLNSICRECSNTRSKKYYSENTEHHKNVIRVRDDKYLLEVRKRIFKYLENHPCIDCGNNNPVVLDFDHRDNVDKLKSISELTGKRHSWGKIETEIDKCDVRCSNCHRIRTAKQQGWYQNLIDDGFWNYE